MSKIELPTVTGNNNVSRINDNFKKIEDALNQEVLYRKGYTGEPNEMETNLDMNGKQILNVATGTSDGSLVTKSYVDQEISEERTYVDQQLAEVDNSLSTKYDKTGGVLSGDVLMQGHKIKGLTFATENSEPVTLGQVLDIYSGTGLQASITAFEALRRSYAEAGYDLIGRFSNTGLVVDSATDVVLWEPTGVAYAYSGELPHTIGAGETPVGNPNWVSKSTKSLRADIQVANYAALRAYTGALRAVYVTGTVGSLNPEGIAGYFLLASDDTTSADNGATVIVDTLGRRWKRSGFLKAARLSWWELQPGYDATAALAKMANCGATELIIDLDVIVTSHTELTGTAVRKIIALGGCGIKRIGNGSIFVKHGMLVASPVLLSNETTAPLDNFLNVIGSDASSINVDDWIFINSNCLSPNVTSGSKTGMLRRVIGKSSNFIQCEMSLSQEVKDPGTTKGKVYKVQFGEKVVVRLFNVFYVSGAR